MQKRDYLHGLHQQLLGYLERDKRYQGQIGQYRSEVVVIGDGQRILYEAPPPEQILFKANLPNVQLSTAIERQHQSYYWELNRYSRDHQGNNISGWIDWFTTLVYKAIVREMVAEQEIEY